MGHDINIETFVNIFEFYDSELLNIFLKSLDYNYSYSRNKPSLLGEIEDYYYFFKLIIDRLKVSQKNGYFFGYKIPKGISEEFDILRFGIDYAINVEIKSQLPNGGIELVRNQLMRHKYVIGHYCDNSILYAYIRELNELYRLDGESIILVDMEDLINSIPDNYVLENPLEKISLTDMIISPYSQITDFANHKYFLTDEQNKVKSEILRNNVKKVAIIGSAGTGKSMLLFDIASHFTCQGKKVLLLFCAVLPNADEISEIIGFKVLSIRYFNNIDFSNYDVVLIDEAQRLYEMQYNSLILLENELIVFSVDQHQTLHPTECKLNIEFRLKSIPEVDIQELSKKVRTDKSMASFIMKFLNLKAEKVQAENYDKVSVSFFNERIKAREFIDEMCTKENYISIELTEYRTKILSRTTRHQIYEDSLSVHSVIGQEYSNVLVPIDDHFIYNQDGKLTSVYPDTYPYIEESCIFEALTRVKDRLHIVVINNPKLYFTILEILSWKEDIYYKKSIENKST